MIVYTVHQSPASAAEPPRDGVSAETLLERAAGHEFIGDGFSFPAAMFAPFWLAAHRVWLPLAGYFAALVVLLAIGAIWSAASGWVAVILVALHVAIGFEASSLRRWALENRGWRLLGTVAGRNIVECERRFYDAWLPGHTSNGEQLALAATANPSFLDPPSFLQPALARLARYRPSFRKV